MTWAKKIFLLLVINGICSFFPGCRSGLENEAPKPVSEWTLLGPGGGGSTFVPAFSYHNPDEIMVRCDMTGNYLSVDGGQSYRLISLPVSIRHYSFDPLDPSVIYAVGPLLYKSADRGGNWEQVFPKPAEVDSQYYYGDHADIKLVTKPESLYHPNAGGITTLEVDPQQKGSLYLAIDSLFYYSSDGGEKWNRAAVKGRIHHIFAPSAADQHVVYIFSEKEMAIFDKGSGEIRYQKYPEAMIPATSFAAGKLKGSSTTIFYAVHHNAPKENDFVFSNSEILTSVDNGMTWQKVEDPVMSNKMSGILPSIVKVVCSENDASSAYVICNNYEEKQSGKSVIWYGALKTEDGGRQWKWVWKGGGGSGQYGVQDAGDAENLKDAWVKQAFGKEFIQLIDVGVSPVDGNLAIVTDWYRTMKTTDGGTTWNEIYSKANTDGSFTSRGMDVTTTYGVHQDPFDSLHIAVSYTDIGYHHSYDGGKSWFRSVNGVPGTWVNTCYWLVFDPAVKDKIFSVWSGNHDMPRGKMTRNPKWKEEGYASGGVCVSTDGGKTWQAANEGMGMNSIATSIVLDPSSSPDNRTLYVSVYNKGVYKSVNGGKSWTLKNKGIGINTAAFEITRAPNGDLYLVVSPTPAHKDGKRGREFYPGALYKSTDGAENWVALNVSERLIFPNGIAVDPGNPQRIYLACWGNIQLADLVSGAVARNTGGDSLLATKGGIFMSEDGGTSWKPVFDTAAYVYDVTIDPRFPGRIYCNTFNHAAWRSDDYGKSWKKLKGYDFHWGHRVIPDVYHPDKVFLTTFGSSVWWGKPEASQ